jgi:hypothetical protein
MEPVINMCVNDDFTTPPTVSGERDPFALGLGKRFFREGCDRAQVPKKFDKIVSKLQ